MGVSGKGKDQKVVVDFGVIGTKTVFARYLASASHGESLN